MTALPTDAPLLNFTCLQHSKSCPARLQRVAKVGTTTATTDHGTLATRTVPATLTSTLNPTPHLFFTRSVFSSLHRSKQTRAMAAGVASGY